MPYNYSHARMGRMAAQNCAEKTRLLLARHEDAFLLGTMGADPYYGGEILPIVGRMGRYGIADRLHKLDGRALLGALLPLCQGQDAAFAYALGFLCHFLLDNRAHGYIEARFPGAQHTVAEIAMDPLVAKRMGEALPPPKALFSMARARELDALHARLCMELFGLQTAGLYRACLSRWLWLFGLQYDPSGKKRALLAPFPRLRAYVLTCNAPDARDLLNDAHAPWGDGHTDSFMELFDLALAEATEWMDMAVTCRASGDYAPLLRLAAGRNADATQGV